METTAATTKNMREISGDPMWTSLTGMPLCSPNEEPVYLTARCSDVVETIETTYKLHQEIY